MNVSKIYAIFALLVVLFVIAALASFSTSSLQWPGLDDVVWPVAVGLLFISIVALLFPIIPGGARLIARSSGKVFFALGYAVLVCYTLLGIVTFLLYFLRRGSGV